MRVADLLTTHGQASTSLSVTEFWTRCAEKAQVLVFAISSPEIWEIRTDGTCSNRGRRLSGNAHVTTGPAASVVKRAEPMDQIPTIGFVRTS